MSHFNHSCTRPDGRQGNRLITPFLCGGYQLPTDNKQVLAMYYPALNQVWIDSGLSDTELILARTHECMHACTLMLQPPQLLQLRAEILGYVDRPQVKHLDDIVETVCEAYFWAETKFDLSDMAFMVEESKYPALLRGIFELAKRIAAKGPKKAEYEKLLKEAVHGISLFLLHIIPNYPGHGLNLIRTVSKQRLPIECYNRWQVFHEIYANFVTYWNRNYKLQKRYTHVLPSDGRRLITDTILFFSGALKVVTYKSASITAVFPVLLTLITQATFVLLPIVYVDRKNNKAKIQLIHPTSGAEHGHTSMLLTDESDLQSCNAYVAAQTLVKESKPYRLSKAPDRISGCMKQLLSILPGVLNDYIVNKCECSGCKRVFQGNTFMDAVASVIELADKRKQAMYEAGQRYERFLLSENMSLIKEILGLDVTPTAIADYEFL